MIKKVEEKDPMEVIKKVCEDGGGAEKEDHDPDQILVAYYIV